MHGAFGALSCVLFLFLLTCQHHGKPLRRTWYSISFPLPLRIYFKGGHRPSESLHRSRTVFIDDAETFAIIDRAGVCDSV